MKNLAQLQQERNELRAQRYAPIFFMTCFAFVFFATQYISVDYTTQYIGGTAGILTAWAILIMGLYLWYEIGFTDNALKRNALIGCALALMTFNGFTIYKTRIIVATQSIDNTQLVSQDDQLEIYKNNLSQATRQINKLAQQIEAKETALQTLRQDNLKAVADIKADWSSSYKKCRTKKCRRKEDRKRSTNITNENNSFRKQRDLLIRGIEQLNQMLKKQHQEKENFNKLVTKRLAELNKNKKNQKSNIKNDMQNIVFAVLIALLADLSSAIFFKNLHRLKCLIIKINHINHHPIITQSSHDQQQSSSVMTVDDFRKKIDKQVMDGTYSHLGQRPTRRYTGFVISQDRAREWHERWEKNGWIIIERNDRGHWVSVRYPEANYQKMGKLKAVA